MRPPNSATARRPPRRDWPAAERDRWRSSSRRPPPGSSRRPSKRPRKCSPTAGSTPCSSASGGRADVRKRIFGDLDALAQRVDGVLLLGVDLDGEEVEALASSPLEVASMGLSGVPWDTVGIDDVQAAHSATSHLLGLGHGDFAILAAGEDDRGTVSTSGDRLRGFSQALAEHHLEVHPDRIIKEPSSIEGGYRAMTELIDNRGLPEAVFAACDEAAFGALKALREHGLSAPKDVSLIAIDDHPMSAVLGLTTVAQPVADQAAFAADLLTERLQGAGGDPQHHRLPVALIERKTTRRPRRQP